MAIKSRLLSKLKATYVIMNMAATSHPQKMHPVYRNLVEARKLCQQGLTESSFAKYGEIYDGLIMAIKQVLSGKAGSDTQEIVGLCKELLQHIVLETSKEEKFKKELVFLPYKYSMWDSMESVWRAAYEDKDNCLVHVIPIPYCNRNPDGSPNEWYCERDNFPAEIPTLDWQEVDLKQMYPDVIFFHYPYDDSNSVTSVDSSYYSRNLKFCTDKLVYIPYFIFDEDCSEADVRNFALSLGVINSDRIIVQSESIREKYISNLAKQIEQTSRYYWEKRVWGLGSPKIDKVLNSRRSDFELPSEWKKMLNGRKIILYITSLVPMLQNTDKICDKLQSIFDIFQKQKDVLLWWRPHPLMKATIHSMRPEIEEEYLQLEKKYINGNWGIYDDTGELHRAISFSDAYYGDGSSVHKLYLKTHKPILIQQFEEIKEIKSSFWQRCDEENIPEEDIHKDFNSGLVMEGEPLDIYDLVETVKNTRSGDIAVKPVERPRWDLIWNEKEN